MNVKNLLYGEKMVAILRGDFGTPIRGAKIRHICETCMKEKSTEDEWEIIRDQIEIREIGMTRRKDFKSIMA